MEKTEHQIRLGIDPDFLGLSFAEKLKTEAAEKGLVIEVESTPSNWSEAYKNFNAPHRDRGLFTIELITAFFSDASIEKKLYDLIEKWLQFFQDQMTKSELGFKKILELLHLRPLCVYYLEQNDSLHFTYDLSEDKIKFRLQWEKMLTLVSKLKADDPDIIQWLDTLARQSNKMSFLQFDNHKHEWVLINRLIYACSLLSSDYRSRLDDPRLGKPQIVFNEENYNDYTYFDSQWDMKLNDLPLIVPQPNDISMYVRLADKSVNAAKEFFDKEYNDKSTRYYLPLIRTEEVLEYYDYFESIIAAVIFSYTSIETLVNICIPEDFIFVQTGTGKNEGATTSYSKKAMERKFHLREKLRQILPQSIQSPDPCIESWWNDFIALEEIRNEIIHTKQHKSNERYSSFLSTRIFTLIDVNKKIIRFYGEYISRHKPELLNEFPYDFGSDSLWPAFMSDEDFKDYDDRLHNPWRPDKSQ